jgi:hypothetical protein
MSGFFAGSLGFGVLRVGGRGAEGGASGNLRKGPGFGFGMTRFGNRMRGMGLRRERLSGVGRWLRGLEIFL